MLSGVFTASFGAHRRATHGSRSLDGDGRWTSPVFDRSGAGRHKGRRRSRICIRAFLSVVSKSVSPGLVPWCTRLLVRHQNRLKANQTRHQDPLEYNAFRVLAQDAHLFSLGLFSTPSRFELSKPKSTHRHLDLVLTTPSTPRDADAFTKSLLVTTPSKPTIATQHCR